MELFRYRLVHGCPWNCGYRGPRFAHHGIFDRRGLGILQKFSPLPDMAMGTQCIGAVGSGVAPVSGDPYPGESVGGGDDVGQCSLYGPH